MVIFCIKVFIHTENNAAVRRVTWRTCSPLSTSNVTILVSGSNSCKISTSAAFLNLKVLVLGFHSFLSSYYSKAIKQPWACIKSSPRVFCSDSNNFMSGRNAGLFFGSRAIIRDFEKSDSSDEGLGQPRDVQVKTWQKWVCTFQAWAVTTFVLGENIFSTLYSPSPNLLSWKSTALSASVLLYLLEDLS